MGNAIKFTDVGSVTMNMEVAPLTSATSTSSAATDEKKKAWLKCSVVDTGIGAFGVLTPSFSKCMLSSIH